MKPVWQLLLVETLVARAFKNAGVSDECLLDDAVPAAKAADDGA